MVWSILHALGEGIRTGLVKVWGVDPKRLELPMCPAIFDRLAYRSRADMLTLLEDAVAEMEARADRKSGVSRDHTPTVAEPLIVVVVDELAALCAYGDRDTKQRTKAALQLLLSQGRAPGFVVIAEAQDASKDVIEFRDLFPTRVCLRVTDAEQVDMALGRGARARGAECDLIPESLPGVGYVTDRGVREPMRVRGAYITDADLTEMGNRWAPGAPALHTVPGVIARGLLARPEPEAA